jgi:hypothetical protein
MVMGAVQLDGAGEPLPSTRREFVIARQVSLDLSTELFDTRLAPGATATLDYREPRHGRAAALRLDIRVEPDRFYRDFYQAMLDNGWTDKGAAYLRQALAAAEASPYTLFEKTLPLP